MTLKGLDIQVRPDSNCVCIREENGRLRLQGVLNLIYTWIESTGHEMVWFICFKLLVPAMLLYKLPKLHINALIESQNTIRFQDPVNALWKSRERITEYASIDFRLCRFVGDENESLRFNRFD